MPIEIEVTCGLCGGTGKRLQNSFANPGIKFEADCNICKGKGKVLPPADELAEKLRDALGKLEMMRPKENLVVRMEDMSPNGRLVVRRQSDGDVIVACMDDDYNSVSVEFCTPFTGGGLSPHTHRALLNLMAAMEKDEEERNEMTPPLGPVNRMKMPFRNKERASVRRRKSQEI